MYTIQSEWARSDYTEYSYGQYSAGWIFRIRISQLPFEYHEMHTFQKWCAIS